MATCLAQHCWHTGNKQSKLVPIACESTKPVMITADLAANAACTLITTVLQAVA